MEEAKRRLELEKEEIERDSTPDRNLKTKADYDDYYVNPILKESDEYIYIPCGFGQSDNGFFIYGIKKAKVCRHPNSNIYALIYNYLTRSSTITEETVPRYIQDLDTLYELDYRTIYRLSIVLLQLIRHNYTENQVIELNYTGDLESLKYAVRVINNYAALFCRLIGINSIQLRVKAAKTGIPISLENKSEGIYVIDNLSVISNAREIWYGRRINYHLTKENLPDLEYILKEISYFDAFKEGQFSALCDMLACKKHAVCIMPTGSGKSLIFYIASLLQPLPMFIVSPTDILIEDQIRNLKNFIIWIMWLIFNLLVKIVL